MPPRHKPRGGDSAASGGGPRARLNRLIHGLTISQRSGKIEVAFCGLRRSQELKDAAIAAASGTQSLVLKCSTEATCGDSEEMAARLLLSPGTRDAGPQSAFGELPGKWGTGRWEFLFLIFQPPFFCPHSPASSQFHPAAGDPAPPRTAQFLHSSTQRRQTRRTGQADRTFPALGVRPSRSSPSRLMRSWPCDRMGLVAFHGVCTTCLGVPSRATIACSHRTSVAARVSHQKTEYHPCARFS